MHPKKTEGFKEGGLYPKYKVTRTDGTPIQEGAEFFVLRVDSDPHSRIALDYYAASVTDDNPKLADGIYDGLERLDSGKKFYEAA